MGSIPQTSLLKGLHQISPWKGRGKRIHQIFSEAAATHSSETALILLTDDGGEERFSYSAVDSESWRLARGINSLSKGLARENQDGDLVVLVCLPPGAELVLTLLAVWKTGSAYLPVEPGAPVQRIQHILAEARPYLVITTQGDKQLFETATSVVTIDELKELSSVLPGTPIEAPQVPAKENIEIILYTSGSTGLSKGVRIKNSSILNRLEWGWREFPFWPAEEVCVFKTALTFVDSVPELWGPLLSGRSVLVIPKPITSNPQRLLPILAKYKVGRLVLVPTLLKSILTYFEFSNEKPESLSHLRLWVCSGESLSVSLAEEFFQRFPDGSKILCNFYGSTEIMGDVTFHVMRAKQDVSFDGKVPIGMPVDNTMVYLLDKDMQIVSAGEIGELYVAGKHIAAGYVNGRDAFRFVQSPHTVDPEYKYLFKTGDYARLFKSTLLFEGRTDSQIKVRGHRVDLSEAEVALNKISGVEKGVVLCYRPGEADQEVLGFVLLEKEADLDAKSIERNLQKSLPNYAVPQIVIIDSIPLLVNGKVDRQYLLQYYKNLSNGKCNGFNIKDVAPGKEAAAERLFEAIRTSLGRASWDKISLKANFYEIGGNSLNSVMVISKLKEEGYTISITDFIKSKNLAEILDRITQELTENGKHFEDKYTIDLIDDKYKEDVFKIIGDSFCEKADIELTMDPPVQRHEYDYLLEAIWPTLVKQKVSIVIKTKEGEVLGASILTDIDDEPEVELHSQLGRIFEFLDYVEQPVKETLLPKGKILHSQMLGTHPKLTPQENIEVTEIMEKEIELIAKQLGYIGIFSTNTSPLTQQLAEAVLNYKKLKTYQINQYVAPDGTRPFKKGDDDLLAICAFKKL